MDSITCKLFVSFETLESNSSPSPSPSVRSKDTLGGEIYYDGFYDRSSEREMTRVLRQRERERRSSLCERKRERERKREGREEKEEGGERRNVDSLHPPRPGRDGRS